MSRVIFDIETVGFSFDALEPAVQEHLLKWAGTDEQRQEVKESLSLYPQTAEIAVLGMYDPEARTGDVLYQAPDDPQLPFEEDGIRYRVSDEKGILTFFWDQIVKHTEFVTFNGRGFDCPFILIRSAVNRLKPRRDLMPNRYGTVHIDLFDQLSFFGATRRRFGLDMWCRTFGIASPKDDGVTGLEVGQLYRDRKYLDIARYCGRDIRATAELLRHWETYLKVQSSR